MKSNNTSVFLAALAFIISTQFVLSYDTWTSVTNTTLEAKLVGLSEEGKFIFESKDKRRMVVDPGMLNEESRKRARAKFAAIESAKNSSNPSKTKVIVKNSTPSFFGSGGGSSVTETKESSNNDTPSQPSNTSSSVLKLANSTWTGKAPWRGVGGQAILRFKQSQLQWRGGAKMDLPYEQVGDGYHIHGKNNTLYVKIIDDKTLTVTVGSTDQVSTFKLKWRGN